MSDSEKPKLRMHAYYYSFVPTGVEAIDKILSAVACAGKSFHNTSDWGDEASSWPGHTGSTPVEWIQNAADEAAKCFGGIDLDPRTPDYGVAP